MANHTTNGGAPAIAESVAIIGLGCMFPGAPDMQSYWANIVGKVDALSDPPQEAWDADLFYDPQSQANDRVYCKRGGFLGPLAHFNPLEYGIMPTGVEGGEPDQWLALKVAYAALRDASQLERLQANEELRHRTAVILGKGTYLNHGNLNMVQHSMVVDQTLQVLQSLQPELGAAELARIRDELKRRLPPFNAEAASGLVPNIVAGRIANRLDLMGPTYTVDAACASSLVAVEIALRELASGSCDLVLAGGVHVTTPIPIVTLFCQLNALSRREQIRPFDRDADGTILGEGVGMVVLKRTADALRDGDRIYAVIRSVGIASDGRGLGVLAPRVAGQTLALQRAYAAANIDPATVELIEAHGTGTPAGDAAEIETLRAVLGPRKGPPDCALGSVKSMIGHTMPAAGMAALIKTALALHYRVLPPTINFAAPDPALELDSSRIYINTETRPWIQGAGPRRAGVNAFGFGGINAHAILEEAPSDSVQSAAGMRMRWDSELLLIAGANREEMVARASRLQEYLAAVTTIELLDLAASINAEASGQACRLAIVATSPADLRAKLEQALKRLADPQCRSIKDIKGIYFFAQPLYEPGRLAFLFPGEGSQYQNMLADLCCAFDEVRACFDRMNRLFAQHPRGFLPRDVMFPAPQSTDTEDRLWQIDGAIEAVLTANQALLVLLRQLGVQADVMLGHSTGEYSVLQAAGMLDLDDDAFLERLLELNHTYGALADEIDIPHAALLAVAASSQAMETLFAASDVPIFIGMDNCPHQTVIVCEEAHVARVSGMLQERGIIHEQLRFDRAYHTPLFEAYARPLQQFLAKLPLGAAQTRAYSCTIAEPYPADPDSIRRVIREHWLNPVRFRETIGAMYADGVRLFVEVGARGNLTAFVGDILRGKAHLAVPANVQHRSGITQMHHLLGILAAHGVPMALDYLYRRRAPRRLSFDAARDQVEPLAPGTMKLKTGWVAMEIAPDVAQELRRSIAAPQPAPVPGATAVQLPSEPVQPAAVPASSGREHVLHAHFQLMEQFLGTQQHLMEHYLGQPVDHRPGLAASNANGAPAAAASNVAAASNESPAASAAAMPTAAAPAPPNGRAQIQQALLDLISDRTGYPVAMLKLEAHIEADLGIDSIKRVEILGAFARATHLAAVQDIDRLAGLKTLGEIIDGLVGAEPAAPPATAAPAPAAPPQAAVDVAHLPFIRQLDAYVPGDMLEARCRLNLDEDLFMRDHTLGRDIAVADPQLAALPIVPLTVSMEILAEAGSLLAPGARLVTMGEIRAHRWILLEQDWIELRVVARREADRTISATLYEADAAAAGPLLEAKLSFGPEGAVVPAEVPLQLALAEVSTWQPEQLYRRGMFHGPAFQVVSAVKAVGAEGMVTRMQLPPLDGFLRSDRAPHFLAEPVMLDAAGQVVGFWTLERLATGFIVFPFRCAAVHFVGAPFVPGNIAECRARIRLTDDGRTLSDIDIVDADGNLRLRLVDWEDKRFDLPRALYHYILAPRETLLAELWQPVADAPPDTYACRIAGFAPQFFLAYGEFWHKVLAYLVLNRHEREQWRALKGPAQRRVEWLLGRVAAKDAVRLALQRMGRGEFGPADIEISNDEQGRPLARGAWQHELAHPITISLSHRDGIAVAMASSQGRQIGIDVETLQPEPRSFADVAFTTAEQQLLGQLATDSPYEWQLRLWCAKEAASKALGTGLAHGPQGIVASDIDVQSGTIRLDLNGAATGNGAPLSVRACTARQDSIVIASVFEVEQDHDNN